MARLPNGVLLVSQTTERQVKRYLGDLLKVARELKRRSKNPALEKYIQELEKVGAKFANH